MKFSKIQLFSLLFTLSLSKATTNIENDIESLVNNVIDGKNIINLRDNNTPIYKLSNIVSSGSKYVYDNIVANEIYNDYDPELIQSTINEKIIEEIDSADENLSKRGYCSFGRSLICRPMNLMTAATCVPWNDTKEEIEKCIKKEGNDHWSCWKECTTDFGAAIFQKLKKLGLLA